MMMACRVFVNCLFFMPPLYHISHFYHHHNPFTRGALSVPPLLNKIYVRFSLPYRHHGQFRYGVLSFLPSLTKKSIPVDYSLLCPTCGHKAKDIIPLIASVEERGVKRGSARRSSLKGRERVIVNQTNIGIVSKATLEKLLRDGMERI